MIDLEQELDDTWRAERDYVIADVNGSAVFLLPALKTNLSMAGRRRIPGQDRAAGDRGVAVLIRVIGLPTDFRPAAPPDLAVAETSRRPPGAS